MNPNLYGAIVKNDQLRFKRLLEEEDESILDQRTKFSSDSTLHLAARFGHAHFAQQIVSLRPHLVEALNLEQETPVHVACRKGSLKVLEILLEVNPSTVVHRLNNRCESALFLACQNGHAHLIDCLIKEIDISLDYSLSSNVAADLSCLRIAVSRGFADFVQVLIEAWPSVIEIADENGSTLLHYACEFGEPEIARMLLILNPEMAKTCDNHGFTPLHLAASQNKATIFKEFEAFAPSAFEVLTKMNETVFHVAVRNNQFDAFLSLVQILGESNELFHRRDQEVNRLLHLAVTNSCLEIAEYLILKATKHQLNTRNYAGDTALGILEKARHDDIVTMHIKDMLLEKLHQLNPAIKGTIVDEHDPLVIQVTETLPPLKTQASSTDRQEDENKVRRTYSNKIRMFREKITSPNRSSSSRITPHPLHEDQLEELYKLEKKLNKRKEEEQEEKKSHQRNMQKMHIEGLQNARNTINIIAILISTVTFTSCLSPPGGFFQGGPHIGKPVLGHTTAFKVFAISNDVALFLSLAIVLVLVSIIPFQKTALQKLLVLTHKVLWLAVSLGTAYIAARWATTLQVRQQEWMFGVVLSICGGFLGVVFVGLGTMLINTKLKRSEWSKKERNERVHSKERTSLSIDPDIESRLTEGYHSY